MSRADDLIERLQAEIVKRDARIAELESRYQHDTPLHKAVFMVLESYTGSDSFDDGVRGLIAELAVLKAQQPSGVVLPEREAVIRKAVGTCNRIPGSTTWNAAEYAYDEFVASLNPCRAQAVTDGWVDIAERLPEIGRHCLIKIPVCGRHEIEGATYEGDGVWASAWCSSRGLDCTYKVSHWMAAPSAKKESGDE